MRLVSAYDIPGVSIPLLYLLLKERPVLAWISHEEMPSFEEHRAFVESKPFRYWEIIRLEGEDVGAIECTDLNEIGVAILHRFQGRGYGRAALRLFMDTHEPLPPIPAKRNAHWLANIATDNHGAKLFFRRNGFRPLQETWVAP